MTLRIYSFLALLLTASAAAAIPKNSTVDLDKGSGGVEFHATGHPSMLKIVGKGSKPKGELKVEGEQVKGAITFDLSSLDTGISLRNKHMKEKYLEVSKYPEAKFTINEMKLPKPLADGAVLSQVPFKGTLNVHGVDKAVDGTSDLERHGDQVKIRAQFGVKVKDFAIKEPSFAGITMADDIQVLLLEDAPIKEEQGKKG